MRHTLRCSRVISLCLLSVLPMLAPAAQAADERQLLQAINGYRAHPQRCDGRTSPALAPLALKSNLALPVGYGGSLRDGLKARGYQAAMVQSIKLVGARDVNAAFAMLRSDYCDSMLDSQYTDIGLTRSGRQWQLVLARPLIDSRSSDGRSADKTLLAQVNAARAKPRMCGRQRFSAARPLSWNSALKTAALGHSRSMATGDYFAHQGPDGESPYDRARAAGYRGRQIGENIAAGQGSPSQAMASWLASPGHCANLMNPMFTQVGAASTADTRSEYGIYWTMMFGAK
ncbi:CAP domain-containing protein [Pseudomonas sp. R5(2019)]|uniref:CAP domain-containing protein n=1 Tax=Pseudomonas sp. R5(2019) TaxID=2697566 RepID=UPI001413673E|nr:CAP domain-containing protein [Pseudomonas sp. R5(2019)]NBA98026.1 CAP domain-containing protein [Pseudomonas sp. R5(2019)]